MFHKVGDEDIRAECNIKVEWMIQQGTPQAPGNDPGPW